MGQDFVDSNESVNEIRATAMGVDVKELRRRRLINKMEEKVAMMERLSRERNYQLTD